MPRKSTQRNFGSRAVLEYKVHVYGVGLPGKGRCDRLDEPVRRNTGVSLRMGPFRS